MKISEAILALQAVLKNEGDLDLLDYDYYQVSSIEVTEASEGQFPKDWEMPEGYKFARLDIVN